MGTMGAGDLLFITMSRNVSFMGKTWWVLMLGLRLLVLLLAGFSLFGDEQERFVCNTLQPGCSNACLDALAPVSALRLWLVQLVLLCLPHALFATYVVHKVLSEPALHARPREPGAPSFRRAYVLVVVLRLLLEAAFGAGQFFLFGLSVPKRFLCYEAPCASGVECFVSRPTEKTAMLNFMLAVASLSALLSLADLVSSARAVVRRRRRRREMLLEEMSKGERSSLLTATTTSEDGDVLSSRRAGSKEERAAVVPNGDALHAEDGSGSAAVETSRPPTPTRTPAPTHFVLHGHLRPPLARRPDRGPGPRVPTPTAVTKLDRDTPGQRSQGSDCQDKRAWV